MAVAASKERFSAIGAFAVAFALCAAAIALTARPAAAAPSPYEPGQNDAGGFLNVLPPGQGQTVNVLEAGAFLGGGERPAHDHDQFDMYANLVYETDGVNAGELDRYFKDASFGVPADERERTYSPRDDVTIVRDEFGVPHIYGDDRRGAMFGAGYITAEDRLFFIDVLRHAGRAELSSFIGGGQAGMDHDVWKDTPYNEDELQLQFELGDELYGEKGALVQQDVTDYVAGINAYIDEACVDATKMPAEYAAIAKPQYPCSNPWEITDVISIASLVAGIFGKGGGGEVGSALVLEEARRKFGRRKGERVWADFRSAEDPEAPTTVRGERFPYQRVPKRTPGLALPDRGTVEDEPVVVEQTGEEGARTSGPLDDLLSGLRNLGSGSNALLVSGKESSSGRPLAVFGPQVSYFAPQILMEQSIHAPASAAGPPIDARGATFPGTNVVVELGRGRDYAWSATSAGQDIIDTFALPLCEPDGGAPSLRSMHYRYRGECQPFDVLEKTNSWAPNAADSTPAGSETLRALRTQLGIVTARARIHDRPYAFTKLRATYFHEVDSVFGFTDFNTPGKMDTPKEFMKAACKIDYTFNWFYINRKRIAYFNSGINPVRSRKVDPNFPALGKRRFEWKGYQPPPVELLREPGPVDPAQVDPHSLTARRMPCDRHPQAVDQRYLTSWNNKQAPAYRAADGRFDWNPLDRVLPLNDRIRAGIRGGREMSLPELVFAMEDAGTVDLRGEYILPWVLRVLDERPVQGKKLRTAIAKLRAWSRSGAHRRDANRDGTYEDAEPIRIMDAWWPLLVKAQFKPVLGKDLFDSILNMNGFVDHPGDNSPNQGSAFDDGWWYVERDLRTLLGERVRGEYSRVYCGRGKLGRCHKALARSLKKALRVPSSRLYAGATECEGGDQQWCYDAVEHQALGAVTQPSMHWINRPTFQQVVEIGK